MRDCTFKINKVPVYNSMGVRVDSAFIAFCTKCKREIDLGLIVEEPPFICEEKKPSTYKCICGKIMTWNNSACPQCAKPIIKA